MVQSVCHILRHVSVKPVGRCSRDNLHRRDNQADQFRQHMFLKIIVYQDSNYVYILIDKVTSIPEYMLHYQEEYLEGQSCLKIYNKKKKMFSVNGSLLCFEVAALIWI